MFNEKEILKFWQENKIFEKSLRRGLTRKNFSFYDGPPFLSGKPHYGHILTAVIKDAVTRFWTMRGFRVERRVGWDCHGLPVENLVEQNLNLKSKKEIEKIGVAKFNAACRDYVFSCEKDFRETLQRVGRWADYSNAYFTLDNSYMESVWWVFKKLWDAGLVYKDFRVTPYCPHCGTPLSNFEVNQGYREAEDPSVYVKFKVKEPKTSNLKPKTFLLVWTTTPWTLSANLALAVGPKINYVRVKIKNGEEFILAEKRLNSLKEQYKIIKFFKGKNLVGFEYQPLYKLTEDKNVYKVISDDFVSVEDGTGIVHIAPAFGEDDMKVGKENNLPVSITVDEEGKMKTPGYPWNGLFVKEADKLILDDLEKRGFLYKKESIKHQYPFCWRCDSPLLYYPLSTWYIAVTKIKSRLIKNNKKIHWVPEHIKEGRFGKWLAGARDWAFSRNRFWGAALPIWQCESCRENIIVGSLKELSTLASFSGNKYFILRHGQAESNHQRIISCWPEKKPIKLTESGRKQIRDSIRILKKKGIHLIFSSDLLRTKETADIVSKELGVEVIFDERLREYNFGEFNGQPVEKFYKFVGEKINFFLKTPKSGENLKDVRKRMMNFILELEKKYQEKNILIVSHGYPLDILEGVGRGLNEKEIVAEFLEKNPILVGELREVKSFNLPYNEDGQLDLHRPYIDKIELRCPKCQGRAKRVAEVFDCWFESGAMPYAQWHYPFENKKLAEKSFPADFIAEGLDQTRGWFYTLHVLATALFGKPAFKNVVVNGLVLDARGRKLSKKLRNYPEPEIIFDKYGADALRFFLLSFAQMGEDYQFSDKGVEETFKKVIDKFRNVFNFFELYANNQFQEVRPPEINRQYLGGRTSQTLNILDQWILARLNEVIKIMTKKMEAYELARATRTLRDFIDDLSNWYLRRSRKRLSSLPTLNYVILETSKLMAPFAPFISEAIYQEVRLPNFQKLISVHLENWPAFVRLGRTTAGKPKIIEEMAEIRRIASLALAKRLEVGIKVRQPLASLKLKTKNLKLKNNKDLLDILKDEVNVKEIIFDKKIKEEVVLDTEITPELKKEGILRELIRSIQGLRQDAGYRPQDKIILMATGPANFKAILERNREFLKKEVNAQEIELKPSVKFDAELNTKINDWQIWLGIRKIK